MNNNQRDPRWKDILIADMSLGQIGCTVSAIGDVIGTTPDVVVTKLKAVGGFLGNLIIWAKISEAFPGITVNRVWSYDNTAVKNAIPNVIVEVPASAIGGTGSHWVNYIGNQQCKDPWTGTVRPTSDFPNPTGYCIITGTWIDPKVAQQAVLDELRTERDTNWNLYQGEVSKNTELTKLYQEEQTKSQSLREANDKLTQADATTGGQLLDVSHQRDILKDIIVNIAKQLNVTLASPIAVLDGFNLGKAIDALNAPHEEVVKQVIPLQDKLFEAAAYKRLPKKTQGLIKNILNFFHL